MKFTKFATSSLISGLLLGLFSCIDNDYDLNKDINLEISVGGNLEFAHRQNRHDTAQPYD